MILYLEAKTNVKDLVIEYIEVILNNGKRVSLNWDESEISRTADGFVAKYRGVYFGEVYANGCIDQLDMMGIADIGVYTEDDNDDPIELTIEEMQFIDTLKNGNEKTLSISRPFSTMNLDASKTFYEKAETFVHEWLKKYPQYIESLRDFEDIADEPDKFYDEAYDMKQDVEESGLNPYDEECRSENEDYEAIYGVMFDDWYDGICDDILVPLIRNIAYKLQNPDQEDSNNA